MTESNDLSAALPKQAEKFSGESFAAFTARPDIKTLREAMAMSAGNLSNAFQTVFSFARTTSGDVVCVGVSNDFTEYTLKQIRPADNDVYLQLKSE